MKKGILQMQLFHTRPVASAVFDEPNLVSAAGLAPVMALACRAGLSKLADEWTSVPTDKGANAGPKTCSLVAGMAAGVDSIDDMAVLRHGGMGQVVGAGHAPSTLGSFLRAMTFRHVRQLDAVAARFLNSLAADTSLLGARDATDLVMIDLDDTIVEVHGNRSRARPSGTPGSAAGAPYWPPCPRATRAPLGSTPPYGPRPAVALVRAAASV